MFQTVYPSPLGNLLLKASNVALTHVLFDASENEVSNSNDILALCVSQLDEYFSKQRQQFDLPLNAGGTTFQIEVWRELQSIPYGQKISYLQLAKRLNNPLVIRAAASANGKNPIPIIIPCHRVVGSKGELVGFSGGLWRKQFLLSLEGNTLF